MILVKLNDGTMFLTEHQTRFTLEMEGRYKGILCFVAIPKHTNTACVILADKLHSFAEGYEHYNS